MQEADSRTDQPDQRQQQFNELLTKLERVQASSNALEKLLRFKELKDFLDHSTFSPQNSNYIRKAAPLLIEMFKAAPPQFEDTDENKLRHGILELISKSNVTDPNRPPTPQLLKLVKDTWAQDNEQNVTLALRLYNSVLRTSRPQNLETHISEFVEFAKKMFRSFTEIVEKLKAAQPSRGLRKGDFSLSVLVECGSVVSFLYQILQRQFQIKDFIIFGLEIVMQPINMGLSEDRLTEVSQCQTRILNFVAQFAQSSKNYSEFKPVEEKLAQAIINMMKHFPVDDYNLRRDLFIGFSHIIKSDHDKGFIRYADQMLDEDITLSKSKIIQWSMRGLWFISMLEFLEKEKKSLTMHQLTRGVALIYCNIHFVPAQQINALNVLKSLLDSVKLQHDRDEKEYRLVNTIVLKLLSKRLSTLKWMVADLNKNYSVNREDMKPDRNVVQNLNDIVLQIRKLIEFCKEFFISITTGQLPPPQPGMAPIQPMASLIQDEMIVRDISKVIKNTIKCTEIYPEKYKNEQVRFLQVLGQLLSTLPPNTIQDILRSIIPFTFVSFITNDRIIEFIKMFTVRDMYRYIGPEVLLFLIDYLELLLPDTPQFQATVLRLSIAAKEPITSEPLHIRKQFILLIEEILTAADRSREPSVLANYGERLFTRCVTLNVLSQEGIGQLAKKLLNIVLNSRELKNQFGKLVREFDPLLAPQPQARDIVQALKSESLDKILQALITTRQQLEHDDSDRPELSQALVGLIYKKDWPAKCSTDIYYEETHRILGDLAGKARVLPPYKQLKTLSSPTTAVKVTIDTGHEKGQTVIYLDEVIKKLVKGLDKRIATEKHKEFLSSAWTLTKLSLVKIFSLTEIKQSSVERKCKELAGVESGDAESGESVFPVQSKALDEVLKNALTALFQLQVALDRPEVKEFTQQTVIRLGVLLFLKHEGMSREPLAVNPDVLLDVLTNLMLYKEPPQDQMFTAVTRATEGLISTFTEVVEGNLGLLTRSKGLRKLLLTLISACHKPEPMLQLGACVILGNTLDKFPLELAKSEALAIFKAALFVLETLPSQTRTKHFEHPKSLLRKLRDFIDLNVAIAHYCGALISSSQTLRELAQKLLLELAGGEHNLAQYLNAIVYPIPCAYGHSLGLSLSDQLSKFVLDSQVHEPLARIIVLENFHFFIQTKIIDLDIDSQRDRILALTTYVISQIPKNDGPEDGDATELATRALKPELSLEEKIACFEAMSAVLRFKQMWDETPEAVTRKYADYRNEIVFRLLRAMTESDQRILEIAKEGIKLVLSHLEPKGSILPHDDLKKCLRPILLVIANPNRVPTLEYLTNFSGLLELIANCFNKHLGERLCKHLEEISRRVSPKDIPLIHRIVSLFHLMPDCVLEVQDKVMHACIECEAQMKKAGLQGYIASTVRDPLVKFLSRFREKALPAFFSNYPTGGENCQYIISLLKLPSACVLRDYVTSQFHVSGSRKIYDVLLSENRFEGLRLINTLCKFMPRWFSTNHLILYQILDIWGKIEKSESSPDKQLIADCYEEKYIFKILISFARYNHKEAIKMVLFTLPLGFARKRMINVSFLSEFLQQELPAIYTPDEKRKIMKNVVIALEGTGKFKPDNDHCSKIIEHLALPMLEESFKRGQGELVLKKKMYYKFIPLWKQLTNQYHNPLCAQLMNLGTLFIKYFKNEFYHYRKELIKFGWNMIKSENPLIKSSAFVNVAYFIQEYGVPEVLIIHFIRNMLGFQNSDHFPAIQKAFGHLSKRIENLITEYQYKEKFMEFVRQQLFRNQQPQSLLNVFDLIIKNEEIFYHFRESMIQQFMHWINTVGMNIHSEYPAKKTLLDLNHLIIRWAERRAKEGVDDFLSDTNQALIINTLARLGQAPAFYVKTTGRNFEQVNALSLKCYPILKSGLSIWHKVTFKSDQWVESMKRCEQLTDTQHRNNLEAKRRLVERCLHIIKAVASFHTRDDIVACPELFIHLAELVKTLEHPMLLSLLCDILRDLLAGQAEQLLFQLQKKIEQSLNETSSSNYNWVVKLLGVICEQHHRSVLQHLPALAKVVLHIAKQQAEDQRRAAESNETLIGTLVILKENIYDIKENLKKTLCQSLGLIFESSQEMKVVQEACALFETWIESDVGEIQLSTKEQCSLLCKLFNSTREMEPTASMFNLAFHVINSQIPPCEAKVSLAKALLAYITKYNLSSFREQLDLLMNDMISNSVSRRLFFILDQSEFPLNPQWSKVSCDVLLASLNLGKMEIKVKDEVDTQHVHMLLSSHANYMRSQGVAESKTLIQSLREVLTGPIADHLFIQLFGEFWKLMPKMQQETLAFSIEKLVLGSKSLSDPVLSNPMKTLLYALVSCSSNQPTLRPGLIQFIAKAYSCWELAIPMLETASDQGDVESLQYMENLYNRLEEKGYEYGCILQRNKNPDHRKGVELMIRGRPEEAKKEFELHLISKIGNQDSLIVKNLWEQATRSLADWSSLREFGEAGNCQANLEAAFQLEQNDRFKELLCMYGLETNPLSSYYFKVSNLPNSIQEAVDSRKPKDTSVFVLFKGVPKYLSPVHLPLLQHISLQKEFSEGQAINTNVMNYLANRRQNHDAEQLITAWKERKTLVTDSPAHWLTLLRVRSQFLEHVGKAISAHQKYTAEDAHIFSTLWISLKRVRLARKQGLYQIAEKTLMTLQPEIEKMEPGRFDDDRSRYYSELVKLSLLKGDPEVAYTFANEAGNLLTDEGKAKALMLKAIVAASMHLPKEAYGLFSEAAQAHEAKGKVWLHWGEFIEETAGTELTSDNCRNALICYFRGIPAVPEKYKYYLPKVLMLLEREEATAFLSMNFQQELEQIPSNLWVPWIHQLLNLVTKSQKPEAFSVILRKVLVQSPQLLFYHLSSRLVSSDLKSGVLQELMDEFNKRYPLLREIMEVLRAELCGKFRPSAEEDFYSALTVLLQRFDVTQPGFLSDLKEALGEIHSRFFIGNKEKVFVETYKEWFESELGSEMLDSIPVREIYLRIKSLRKGLFASISRSTDVQSLEHRSPLLSSLRYSELLIPGTDVSLDRILPSYSSIPARNFNKKISFRGTDYKVYSFAVTITRPNSMHSFRVQQVLSVLNDFFRVYNRLNSFEFMSQKVVPLNANVRLVECAEHEATLQEMFEACVNHEGKEADCHLLAYMSAVERGTPDPTLSCSQLVHKTALTSYLQMCLRSAERYFVYRKQFTVQWSLYLFLSQLLGLTLNSQLLTNVWINRSSGTFSYGFASDPQMGDSGIEGPRLSENMKFLIGSAGLAGLVPMVTSAAADVLDKKKNLLTSVLKFILRDEEKRPHIVERGVDQALRLQSPEWTKTLLETLLQAQSRMSPCWNPWF